MSFQRSSFLCVYVGGFQFFPKKNKTKQNIVVHRIFVLLVSRLRFYVVGISKESPEPLLPLRTGLGPTETLCFSRTGEQSYLGPACLINNAGPELHF